MNQRTSPWMLTSLLALSACDPAMDKEPAPTAAESQSPLLGAVNYGGDCTATDKQFLGKAMHYGRTVAVSNAFAQCLNSAVRTGVTARAGNRIGPYLQCNGDPFFGSDVGTQIAKVTQAVRSTVDLAIGCTGGGGNASAGIGSYGQLTPETLNFSGWLRGVEASLGFPLCNGSNGPNCRSGAEPWPWSQTSNIIWHEGLHQQGYIHGTDEQASAKVSCGYAGYSDAQWHYQVNTMPYIAANCIEEVIVRSGALCGAPLESGNGLRLITDFNGSVCSVASDPQDATVSWRQVGRPWAAAKIAACSEADGRLYAMNADHSLWVNTAGGTDGGWRYVTTPGSAQQITCAGNKLYAVNGDRTLWRNDGSDTAVRWTYVGRPPGARQITGATALAVLIPYGVLYALNDDNTLWRSSSGADGSWTYLGRPAYAARIAAGGGLAEARPFALNADRTLWLNSGDGCNQYWHPIDTLSATDEISASNQVTLYALNTDKTLWKGSVQGSSWMTTLAFGQPRRCNGTALVP